MGKNYDVSSRAKKVWDWLLRKHQGFIVFVCIFLLLFLGGYRFHMRFAVVFSFMDALCLMLFYELCTFIHSCLERKKKYHTFLTMFVVLLLVIFLIVQLDNLLLSWISIARSYEHDLYNVSKVTMLVLGTYIAWLLANYSRKQRKLEQLLMEKKEIELRMLRSQLNPHFVFNTLNNIYSLVYTHDEKAPESILQMADMCRYITDECQSDYVGISKEVNYINNYINLQKVKLGEKNITFVHHVENSALLIPPMLLQPLVENCFIHGDIASNAAGFIHISIQIENRVLTFEAVNSKKSISTDVSLKKREGIGIVNVEQQLRHYYNNKYQLDVKDMGDTFSVLLKIELRP